LFGLLKSLGAAFDSGAEIAGEDRLVTINRVSLIQPLPYNYLSKVQTLDGVEMATLSNWFGGYYQEKGNQFPQFAVEAEAYFDIYKDLISLPPEQMAAWKADRVGVVIGRALAQKFQWKIGERIPLIATIFPQKSGSTTWEFVVTGIYDAKDKRTDTSAMLMHYDYFDKARQFGEGQLGWLIIKVKIPAEAEKIAAAVDAKFANSFAETKTSSEKDFAKSFAKQFADIGLITTLILSAVFFTMLLVAGNTMAQSFRERIPELAVLKTLGFGDGIVMRLILAEALLMVFLGGFLGLGISAKAVAVLADTFAANLPGLTFSVEIFTQGVAVMFLVAFLAGIVPAIQGLRLNIVTALRRR
jgi:putative ABC transport system permease protein